MNLNTYGCACRCLLELLRRSGNPLTEQEFLNRYLPKIPIWQKQPGITDTLMVFQLAVDLRLASRISVFRDYDIVLKQFEGGASILVQTERELSQDATQSQGILYHCTLLDQISTQSFVLWSPFQNGTAGVLPPAAPEWWEKWMGVGIILTR